MQTTYTTGAESIAHLVIPRQYNWLEEVNACANSLDNGASEIFPRGLTWTEVISHRTGHRFHIKFAENDFNTDKLDIYGFDGEGNRLDMKNDPKAQEFIGYVEYIRVWE